MKYRSFTFLFLFAAAALALVPAVNNVRADGKLAIGTPLDQFSLADVNNKTLSVKDLQGSKGTVFIFISAQCPVVRGYVERIQTLSKEYGDKGINFVGINANSSESLADAKAHADANFKFPVLIDTGNKIADKWGANTTPEVFFFGAAGKLVYRGGIDNSIKADKVTKNSLRDALDSSLAGKAVAETTTPAFGCTIKRVGE
jgi:peroxiredoxin